MVDNALTRSGAREAIKNLSLAFERVAQSQPPALIVVDDEGLLECPWCGRQTGDASDFVATRYRRQDFESNLIDYGSETLDFGHFLDDDNLLVIVVHGGCGNPVQVPAGWQQYWSS